MRAEVATQPRAVEVRSRARLAMLVALVALVPLLALAWLAAVGVGKNELHRTDLRLEAEGRTAAAAFVSIVAEADGRAGRLASSPALQNALAARDRAALRRLVGPHDVVSADRTVLVGKPDTQAVRRTVSVAVRGRAVGSVIVEVPLDASLIRQLRLEAAVDEGDRLALFEAGHSIAGSDGAPVAVPLDRPVYRDFGGTSSRVFAMRLVRTPTNIDLLALTPRSEIGGGARDRLLWTLLAVLVTLATIGAAGYALAPSLLARRGSLGVLGGRSDERALALVGDAFASTHDPERLLPVILDATMDATGAVGGRVLRNGRVAAEAGDVAGAGRPLRLELGPEEGEEIALQLWPATGGFDARTRSLAQTLAAQAAIALDNARLHSIVKRQAITDELTELANRRHFMETLDTELRRAERFDESLALVFADLDDFKRVNDRFGHHVGDAVLRSFADCLRRRVRAFDVAARLGGEEFAVLLPETDLKGAQALAESLREAVAELEVRVFGGAPIRTTASFGVAAYPQTHNADELMAAADRALYQAKRAGKNRVISAD